MTCAYLLHIQQDSRGRDESRFLNIDAYCEVSFPLHKLDK